MSASLHARARNMLARTRIRRWELRQRDHAKGSWYRVRRLLAGSERVFVVDDADFELLLGAGHELHAAGLELHPERRITSAASEEISALTSARELRVRLSAELLGQRNWVVVPFN